MAVSNTQPRIFFTGNGATTTYPFTFEIFNQADIEVFVDGTKKTLNSDYTIANTSEGTASTGNVEFTSAPANTTSIAIISNRQPQRTTSFADGGVLRASSLNDDLDNLNIATRDTKALRDETIKIKRSDAGSFHANGDVAVNLEIPELADRINTVVQFDSAGNLTACTDIFVNITGNVEGNVGNITGTVTGNVVGDIQGNITGNVTGNVDNVGNVTGTIASVTDVVNVSGNVAGNVDGNVGNVTNVTGTVTTASTVGNVTGNVSGNVGNVTNVTGTVATAVNVTNVTGTIANVSNVTTVGNVTGTVTTATTVGTVSNDVTGNVIGTVQGNVNGNVGNVLGNVTNVTGSVTGNVTGNVDGEVNGDVNGNINGTVVGTISGNVTGNVSGTVGNVAGSVGNVTGNVGNVTGTIAEVGNVTGSVATANTVGTVTGTIGTVNTVTNVTTASAVDTANTVGNVTGTVAEATTVTTVGNVTGNISGNVTGNVGGITGNVGNVTGTVTEANLVVRAQQTNLVDGNVAGNVQGSVVGNVGGNVQGSVGGNVYGNVIGSVGNVTGNVGNITGTIATVGDVTGNVTGTVGNVTNVTLVTGNVGNVTGNVGNVTGDVTGNVTGNVGGVTGNVDNVGNVGNVTGTITNIATATYGEVKLANANGFNSTAIYFADPNFSNSYAKVEVSGTQSSNNTTTRHILSGPRGGLFVQSGSVTPTSYLFDIQDVESEFASRGIFTEIDPTSTDTNTNSYAHISLIHPNQTNTTIEFYKQNQAGATHIVTDSNSTAHYTLQTPEANGTIAVTTDIPSTTDNLTEGTTNLYFSNARAQAVSINNLVEDVTPQLGGPLDVNNQNIVTTASNPLILAPDSGADTKIQSNTVMIGQTNTDIRLTTNGTGDLTLDTNDSTNSGKIVIRDGANQNIEITPNGTGKTVIKKPLELTGANGSINALFLNNFDGGTPSDWGIFKTGIHIEAEGTNGSNAPHEFPSITLSSYDEGNGYPNLWLTRSKSNDKDSPAYLAYDDMLFAFFGAAWDNNSLGYGADYYNKTCSVEFKASETHSASGGGGKIEFYTTDNGSWSGTGTKRLTIDEHVTMDSLLELKAYASTSLPTGVNGAIIAISDNNYKPAYYDGTSWKYIGTDGAV